MGDSPEPRIRTGSPRGGWTRVEDYLDLRRLWRNASPKHRRRLAPRTEPERPRPTLGTIPFLLLLVLLGMVSVGVIMLAWPGKPPVRPRFVEEQRPRIVIDIAPRRESR